jgi:hypothetical protein
MLLNDGLTLGEIEISKILPDAFNFYSFGFFLAGDTDF